MSRLSHRGLCNVECLGCLVGQRCHFVRRQLRAPRERLHLLLGLLDGRVDRGDYLGAGRRSLGLLKELGLHLLDELHVAALVDVSAVPLHQVHCPCQPPVQLAQPHLGPFRFGRQPGLQLGPDGLVDVAVGRADLATCIGHGLLCSFDGLVHFSSQSQHLIDGLVRELHKRLHLLLSLLHSLLCCRDRGCSILDPLLQLEFCLLQPLFLRSCDNLCHSCLCLGNRRPRSRLGHSALRHGLLKRCLYASWDTGRLHGWTVGLEKRREGLRKLLRLCLKIRGSALHSCNVIAA
mmetsp:Transcript_42134/g.133769  ORF Transcript_42134/g.133769 Transcript_42134/m.133769 type:complete len:291 (+) Transcript_42134:869-1741(+)